VLPELLEFLESERSKNPELTARLRFTLVYVEEAHAEDEWPIGNAFRTDVDSPLWSPALLQSRTGEERLARANRHLRDRFFPSQSWIRVVADRDNHAFQTTFGAWPTGFYLIETPEPPARALNIAVNQRVDDPLPRLRFVLEPERGMFRPEPLFLRIRQLLGLVNHPSHQQ
jgi:hypothetical protein